MKDWKQIVLFSQVMIGELNCIIRKDLDFEHVSFYCSLVPKGEVEDVLKSTD